MPPFDILGTFQDPLKLDEGAAKLTNVRVVPREMKEGKVAKVRFVGSPGLITACQPTTSPCITLCHAQGTLWSGHADGSIYHHVETNSPTFAGTVLVDLANPVIRMAEDRTALAIASNKNVNGSALGGTAYVATLTGGVVNANFNASINFDPSAVAELDNFTLWSGASNFYSNQDSKVYRSQPLDPGNVLPNSFGTKEARADRVVDLALAGRVVWVLGARSTEQWYNGGAAIDMPFIPFPNSLSEIGIAVRTSLAELRGNVVFVGTDKRVWRCAGQTAQPISAAWVDLLLQQLTITQLQQLTAYAYGQGGSDFYVLTLPGSWTIELSASTGVWTYRQSPGGRPDHAGRCAAEHDGGNTFVGLDTGHVCFIDINNSSEPGGTLSREIISPWLGRQDARDTLDSLDVTSSMGPDAGAFLLDWSIDKAQTWNGLRTITMPQPGTRRAIARNMGTMRRRQLRLRYSGTQAPFTIDELFANVTAGF